MQEGHDKTCPGSDSNQGWITQGKATGLNGLRPLPRIVCTPRDSQGRLAHVDGGYIMAKGVQKVMLKVAAVTIRVSG